MLVKTFFAAPLHAEKFLVYKTYFMSRGCSKFSQEIWVVYFTKGGKWRVFFSREIVVIPLTLLYV